MARFLFITSSFPDLGDGSEAAGSFILDFALALSQRGPTTVVAPTEGISTRHYIDDLAVRRFQVPRIPLSTLSPLTEFGAVLQTMRSGLASALHAARQDRPDFILAAWTLPCGWWARRAAAELEVGYGVWALGSDIWTYGRNPLTRPLVRRILKSASRLFADGYELAGEVEALSGKACKFLPSSRRLTAGDGGRHLRAEPPYRLGFLGRWHPNKGIDLLLDALTRLSDADWNRIERLTIAGGGPLDQLVRSRVGKLADRGIPVTVRGYLDKPCAADFLGSLDYVIVPSRIESIPVILSDAMQAMSPMLVTPVGDMARVVESYGTGLVARGADPDSLVEALQRALATPPDKFRPGLQNAGRDFRPERAAAVLADAI